MKDSKTNIAKTDDDWQPCKEGISSYMYRARACRTVDFLMRIGSGLGKSVA